MPKHKIGIIGATGYTGSELVRILLNHPDVEISFITSESRKGEKFSDVHPFFKNICDQTLISIKDIGKHEVELVFLALPHGVSMDFVKDHADRDFKIVDLSGDFRLKDPETYKEWYQKDHVYKEGFKTAVFGIPELFSEDIKGAKLLANPGCYPTSAILGLAPLVENNMVEPNLIIDSKSGVTGAGVKSKPVNHFSNVNDNFKAYGVKSHRHTIEIEQIVNRIGQQELTVQFTPHLLPIDRGILSTIYATPKDADKARDVSNFYKAFYQESDFIRIVKSAPGVKDVRGTNYCNIFTTYDERTNRIITISVIDNLVRGAAGQAVQNMNLMLGLEEASGLNQIPLNP